MNSVRSVSSVTCSAKSVNEDVLGYTHGCYWVIDGVTGEDSTVEFVNSLNSNLYKNISEDEEPLSDLVKRSIQDITTPGFATIALIRVSKSYIDYFIIGDCSIFLWPPKGAGRITDSRGERFNREEIKSVHNHVLQGDSVIEARRKAVSVFEKSKMVRNTEAGYWVLCNNIDTVSHAIIGREPIYKDHCHILLTTDGYSDVVDVFNHYNSQCPQKLFEHINDIGVGNVAQMILSLQQYDYDCKLYPRTKPYDDISAIYIKA